MRMVEGRGRGGLGPKAGDPGDLGRSRLTRWLPVLWHASAVPPHSEVFTVDPGQDSTRFLLSVLFSVKRLTIPAAACGIAWQAGEALVPVVMGAAIDDALATGDVPSLLVWLGVLAIVFIVLSLGFRFASQQAALATEITQHRLRLTLSRAVLHADGVSPQGGVVSLMTNDVMRTAALGLTVFPIAEFVGIVVIAVSLLLIDWPLGLMVLAGAPLTVWLMGVLSGRLARDTRRYQALLASTVARATDLVAGYRVIKGIGAEDEAAARYRLASRDTLHGAYRNVGLLGRFLVGSTTVSGVFVAVVAAVAGWFAITDRISVGELIAAVGLAQALLLPMRMLAMNAVPAWAAARASSARIVDALAESQASPQPTPPAGSRSRSSSGGRRDVEVPVVEAVLGDGQHVRLEPGELVGVRADDATAAALSGVFLRPQTPHSRLSIGGLEAGHAHFDAVYRSAVVVSPHHATLFSGTIGDNLGDHLGGRARSSALALQAAACEDFVEGVDGVGGVEGVDREVGEMGNRLSGGQRQRLALARALAAEAPVLVLHDPTTAVDSVTEAVIASRLPAVRKGGSTLLITSSPVLLGICDRVVDLSGAVPDAGVAS